MSTGDQPIGNATIVAEEMTRWLRDVEGFEGFLMLSREGTTLGLTFWRSRELADRARPLRMEFVERITAVAGVRIEAVDDYEIAFANLPELSV